MVTETTIVPPSWVSQALDWVGLRWPEGDTGRISAAGDAWLQLGKTLREQHAAATAAAQRAWSPPNRGGIVDDFREWWSQQTGPGANLLRAAGAAEATGTALRGLAIEILVLRGLFIAQLAWLVATLVGAGLLIAGSAGLGTVAVAGGGTLAVNQIRRTLVREVEVTGTRIGTQLIVGLLRRAITDLAPVRVPVPPLPVMVQDREPDPDPKPGPRPPIPPFLPWRDDERPRCTQNPDTFLPRPPIVLGGADPRTLGGRIVRIQQQLDGTVRVVTIDGVMGPPLPPGLRLADPQRDLQIAGSVTGIPSGVYDACHAYGPGFGSEAAAGMGLCPRAINQYGQMADLEARLRNLYRDASSQDGWVELSVTSHTFPTSAWPDAESRQFLTGTVSFPSGANLLQRVDYDATVCRPGQVVDTYRFGLLIGAPTIRGGVFQTPSSTVYGRPPP